MHSSNSIRSDNGIRSGNSTHSNNGTTEQAMLGVAEAMKEAIKAGGNKKKNKRRIKRKKSFGEWEIISIFAIPFGKGYADVAQLARARDL